MSDAEMRRFLIDHSASHLGFWIASDQEEAGFTLPRTRSGLPADVGCGVGCCAGRS